MADTDEQVIAELRAALERIHDLSGKAKNKDEGNMGFALGLIFAECYKMYRPWPPKPEVGERKL
jgi:hypothetical protein